jgi:hypothetical protein
VAAVLMAIAAEERMGVTEGTTIRTSEVVEGAA